MTVNMLMAANDTPDTPPRFGSKPAHMAWVVTCGNEKGGSGKSTTAMHIAIALLRLGYGVGTIDLDARQGTLTRYMKNRWDFVMRTRHEMPAPPHMAIPRSEADSTKAQQKEEQGFLTLALAELSTTCDFVVIDTPGTDSYLSRLAHYFADTLVTPLNDSLIDMDVLARIDPDTDKILGASHYAGMILEQHEKRIRNGLPTIDWIVMRNRISHLKSHNRDRMDDILSRLGGEFGFRTVDGFGERVIFKELFLKGLTLLDLKEEDGHHLSVSEISARQEVRNLIHAIGPEKIKGYAQPL